MNTDTLRALRRSEQRRLDKFIQRLQAHNKPLPAAHFGPHGGVWPASAPHLKQGLAAQVGAVGGALQRGALAVWLPARELGLALAGLGKGAVLVAWAWPWKRIALGSTAVAAAASAMAATQVYIGYRDHPAQFWQQRLEQRLGSAIFSGDGQLQGTLFPAAKDAAGLDFANYGYIPPQGELPPFWRQAAVTLEQKSLFNGWRNVCGIDPLGTAKRVLTLRGGGSGLAQQNAKNLMAPEEVRPPDSIVLALMHKLREVGAACALYESQGGAEGMLRLYASYAPVAQVSGTTRGEEAGAWVLFNAAPQTLQPYQQALLASLAQRPLSLVPASAFQKGCSTLKSMPRQPGPASDETKAANQCAAIGRARSALRDGMPPGPELDAQLAALDALERTGIVPANPFAPLPTRRLVNLSTRTQAAMSGAMLQRVTEEAEGIDSPPGTPLTLTMAQPEQQAFSRDVRDALKQIDESTSGREALCVPLAFSSPLRHCPNTPDEAARADVVLARMSVVSGAVTRLFESSRIAAHAHNAIGSVGKMIIAMVAVQHGYTADTLVCPRQARDGDKLLRRVTQPEFGYKRCGPREKISFAEAMARSDNLAAYDVARALPPDALRRGIQAVGLTPDPDPKANLAYALAFGTQAGTPGDLLALGQALFGAAFGVPVRSGGPRVLASNQQPVPAYHQVMALLPQPAQRHQLRELLQAPVQHPRGTLRHLKAGLDAGKTGTTSARFGPQPGSRPYVQAKFTLGYSAADRTVALAIINAPAGHALGMHNLAGQTLAPALTALLK